MIAAQSAFSVFSIALFIAMSFPSPLTAAAYLRLQLIKIHCSIRCFALRWLFMHWYSCFCHIGSQTHLFGLRACAAGALHIGGVDIQVSTLASYLQWQSVSDQWSWSSNNLSPGSVSDAWSQASRPQS